MKRFCFYVFLLLLNFNGVAQNVQRPKLVVGIVVDQMRWDYLYRFYDRYGNDGFKRLLREGFSCENSFIPFIPTVTAAGHASIYTGSVPALNGLMGNFWFDKTLKRNVYCTEDNSVQTVGSTSGAGKMSPKNLWSNTITDELRLATNFSNKTIAISLKDRGSILPGGHTSNGSYWFDNESSGWITSSFYMQQLPTWLNNFNAKKLPAVYLKQGWKTMYPISTYLQSTADSNAYESNLPGEDFVFPHSIDTITKNPNEAFRFTPQGSTYTFETAKAAIAGEGLGAGKQTDFLALSFSSPDYIGHAFGANSVEIEDTYLRFDKDLADFLKHLDAKIGKGRYLIFLTSDHGVAHNAAFLKDHKLPTGSFEVNTVRRQMNDSLKIKFNTPNIISQIINSQIYFDDSVLLQKNIDKQQIKNYLLPLLLKNAAISNVVDLADISIASLPDKRKWMLSNGYNQKLSGDLQYILKPQWFDFLQKGASHSSWNPYDSQIPLLWFGWNIKPGKTNREVYITDIAPTLAALLHIQTPNACVGNVIEEVVGMSNR